MTEGKRLSFIIPCYNSEKTIRTVVNSIKAVCENQHYNYQIILSNDGSTDDVWKEIKQLCNENENIIGLCMARNFGQQSARMAAIPYVVGDYVFFMDDDGQHPADGIIPMLKKIDEGYDLVYAHFAKKQAGILHWMGSDFNQFTMEWLIGKPKDIKISSFFLARRYVVEELKKYKTPAPMINAYFMQITKNIANVDLEHQKRIYGKSGYNFPKLVRAWVVNTTSFSIQPLIFSGLIGTAVAGVGFIWAVCLIVKKLLRPDTPVGYTSIVVTILICSGLIMIMLGIIGEYIGKLTMTANNAPQYVIREKLNVDDGGEDYRNVNN